MARKSRRCRALTWLGGALDGWPALPLSIALLSSCQEGPNLSNQVDGEESFDVGEIPADGPKLGAVADVARVYERPSRSAKKIGYLHAGALVARSEESFENEECTTGWYAVRPRGFVCSEKSVTVDLEHPTLQAMALGPKLDQDLPYTYARSTKVTALFERAEGQGVEQSGRLKTRSGMAIVGAWTAPDESREPQRLGLMMNGQFVRAADLRESKPSEFSGVELGAEQDLPFAFVVKRGVRAWALEGQTPQKATELTYHEKLPLTGRFRTVQGERFWAVADGRWVRHRDVTAIRRRHELPDFVHDGLRWVDVSVITGTAVFYEGKKPVFATLVSVGRDRLGDPKTTASTERGTFEIVGKQITYRDHNPVEGSGSYLLYDVPWVLELSNGQLIQGSYWHDRFGIEHTDGNVHLSPKDAARLFRWATPQLPEGWHGVRVASEGAEHATKVLIRK